MDLQARAMGSSEREARMKARLERVRSTGEEKRRGDILANEMISVEMAGEGKRFG